MQKRSQVFRAVEALLLSGFTGTYGQLAAHVGSIGRAMGPVIKAFAKQYPGWNHGNVYSAKTGFPAYL